MTPHRLYKSGPSSSLSLPLVLLVLFLGVFVLWVILTLTLGRWEGQPPRLTLDRNFTALGKKPSLNLRVDDEQTGLKQVSVVLEVKGQPIRLVDQRYPGPSLLLLQKSGAQTSSQFNLGELITANYQIREGPRPSVDKRSRPLVSQVLRGQPDAAATGLHF